MGNIVRGREETNKRILDILEKQLDNLTAKDTSVEQLKQVAEILYDMNDCPEETQEIMRTVTKQAFGIN